MEKAIGRTDYTHRIIGGKRPSLRNQSGGGSQSLPHGPTSGGIALTSVLNFDKLPEHTSMRRYPTAEFGWAESLI